ncbi:hypothetical protein P167DRAFT_531284 [Morchella conica CCBAS932]|uniref:Swiss Army Knife RNA repair protein HAD domain-containing protein n=1 Tax=Morchella conica CCBAS932 TaxID=1392247 RepID=A0A3N4L7J3_9PEZI|nr:hypothetical protein P167DRAFT_531284 [Morchella conica CCBAS932]
MASSMYTNQGGPAINGSHAMVGFSRTSEHTLSNLSRWSIQNRSLPRPDTIKTIHVYDFDNTLFMSPLPNTRIWTSPTLGLLQRQGCFMSGGWWHDSRFLAATGKGLSIEEDLAWEGWWNEPIVDLVELSRKQNDALTILLTGRSVSGFSDLIQRMVASKGLDFDIIALKPGTGPNLEHIRSTILFKCMFLEDVLNTYHGVEEIRVYEDRVKHVRSFEEFFAQYILTSPRGPGEKPLVAEVIQVAEIAKTLDPVAELTIMQKVIDDHNTILEPGVPPLQIKKNVFYTGYLLSPSTTSNLLKNLPLANEPGMKFLANNILITPRPANQQILSRVGGIGNKVDFDVFEWGCWENKVWAARVRPSDRDIPIYTESSTPIIVLALRGWDARPADTQKITNWQPLPENQVLRISTIVGEKLLLRIEENTPEGE